MSLLNVISKNRFDREEAGGVAEEFKKIVASIEERTGRAFGAGKEVPPASKEELARGLERTRAMLAEKGKTTVRKRIKWLAGKVEKRLGLQKGSFQEPALKALDKIRQRTGDPDSTKSEEKPI